MSEQTSDLTTRDRLRTVLAFRAGLLLGTVNLARDLGMGLDEVAELTRLTPEALAAWSPQVVDS